MDLLTKRLPWSRDTMKWPAPFESRGIGYAGDGFVVADLGEKHGYVDLPSHRYELPRYLEALVDRPGLPGCQLAIVVGAAGPACARLVLAQRPDDPPLTASQIRKVRLDELVKEIATLVGAHNIETGRFDREGFERDLAGMTTRPEPGKRIPDHHLAAVADVYRYALRMGWPATNKVAEAFDVSRSTAGRWVVETRRRGLLGPAIPGRAGELEQKEEDHG